MRLIQYLIFLLLVINGLTPLLTDNQNMTSECVDVETVETGNQEENPESEDSSEDDLVAPDHKVLHEPKPHEIDSNPTDLITANPIFSGPQPYSNEQIKLNFWDTYPKISDDLKEHIHFSKRPSYSYS